MGVGVCPRERLGEGLVALDHLGNQVTEVSLGRVGYGLKKALPHFAVQARLIELVSTGLLGQANW
jgi:hypothetical protein